MAARLPARQLGGQRSRQAHLCLQAFMTTSVAMTLCPFSTKRRAMLAENPAVAPVTGDNHTVPQRFCVVLP